MAEFMLHIIKVNVLSAIIIFIVLAVSRLLDRKYSSRWKYLIWLYVQRGESAVSCRHREKQQ